MSSQYDEDDVLDAANCPICLELTEHEILKRTKKGKGEEQEGRGRGEEYTRQKYHNLT